jgi:hypothetical protein
VGERRYPLRRAHAPDAPRPGSGSDLTRFQHLAALTDEFGLFEHARLTEPRIEHGYCADDVGRALAVVCREKRSDELDGLAAVYLAFLEQAQLPDGRFRNRRSAGRGGRWQDEAGSDDAQGRALYGLGVAAASGRPGIADRALRVFEAGAAVFDSPSPRANAWAAIGASEVAVGRPGNRAAPSLLERACPRLGRVAADPGWPWPEHRLAYDNARIPEARIAAGAAFSDETLLEEGLELLLWLAGVEMGDGCFSFSPVGGWAPGEPRPGFDQQPVEAGTMADACVRAYAVTGESEFAALAVLAARWFLGVNDTGAVLLDPATGGCCDGLQENGRNLNQGAESTVSALAALQAAARSASSSSSIETHAAPTARSAAPYVM